MAWDGFGFCIGCVVVWGSATGRGSVGTIMESTGPIVPMLLRGNVMSWSQ